MPSFVYAVQNGDSSTSLYSSDDTTDGTIGLDVSRFDFTSNETPLDFMQFDGKLVFLGYTASGNDGIVYGGVGITDGTAAGTAFTNVGGPNNEFVPQQLGITNGHLLVSGQAPLPYGEFQPKSLWSSTDGSTFALLANNVGLGPEGIVNSGSVGYFTDIADTQLNQGLYRTDGTAAGTYELFAGSAQLTPGEIIPLSEGQAVFFNQNPDFTYSLYASDGTSSGTRQVVNAALGTNILSDNGGASTGSRAIFSAIDAANNISVWSTDGTAAGTVELYIAGQYGDPIRLPDAYVQLANKVLFDTGYGVQVTDGTIQGTHALSTVQTDGGITVAGSKAFFFQPMITGTDIFVTDGTVAGTQRIHVPNLQSFDGSISAVGNQVVFTGTDLSQKESFFTSDGTVAGTTELSVLPGVTIQAAMTIGALPALTNSDGVTTLEGGDQAYTAVAGTAVFAAAGNDTIIANAGQVTATGGSGQLTFFGGTGESSVFGSTGSDILFSGAGGGRFSGGSAGNNILISQGASGANTTLTGGGAGDRIFGSASGNDMIAAGAGREIILGGGGPTTIQGGTARDIIFTGVGPSTVFGGTGAADTIVGGSGPLSVTAQNGDAVFGDSGTLNVIGSKNAADSIIGGTGALTINGQGGNMLAVVGTGTAAINTGNGASLIFTEAGNSTITGGAGSMQIVLGLGLSSITDGGGPTTFDVIKSSAGGSDVLSAFKVGTDKIDLFGYSARDVTTTASGGNTLLSFSDGTKIEVLGVTNLGGSVVG